MVGVIGLAKQSEAFHNVLGFLDVSPCGRLAVAAPSFRKACCKDDKLVAGALMIKMKSIAQLSYVHLQSLSSLDVSTRDLGLAVVLLRTVNLRSLTISSGSFELQVWEGLCSTIEENTTLHTLIIKNCNLLTD